MEDSKKALKDALDFADYLFRKELNMYCFGAVGIVENVALLHAGGDLYMSSMWPNDPRKFGDYPTANASPTLSPYRILAKTGILFSAVHARKYKIEVPIFTPVAALGAAYSREGGVAIVLRDGRCAWVVIDEFYGLWDRAFALLILWRVLGHDVQILEAKGSMDGDVYLKAMVSPATWYILSDKLLQAFVPELIKDLDRVKLHTEVVISTPDGHQDLALSVSAR